MPEELVKEIKSILKNSLDAKKDFNTSSVKLLQKNYNDIQKKLDTLLEVRLEQSITKDEYDKKSNALRAELHNIENKMRSHTTADKEFAITLEYLLDLASRSYTLFESSGIEQKRKIINLSFLELLSERLKARIHNKKTVRHVSQTTFLYYSSGAKGFEPLNGWTKTICLTAWLRPNNLNIYNILLKLYFKCQVYSWTKTCITAKLYFNLAVRSNY